MRLENMTSNYLIWALLKPSHALLVLLIFGCVLAILGRHRASRWVLAMSLAALLLLGVLPAGAWLSEPLENRFPEPELPPEVDGIIVLAGAEDSRTAADRQFPEVSASAERLIVGAMLAHRYPEATLLHSGESPSYSVADLAHDLYLALGVDEERLKMEARSVNTCESAAEIAERFADSRDSVWLLVTSAVHMPRSVACFRASGWSVIPVPVDYLQAKPEHRTAKIDLLENLNRVDKAAHEWLGLFYYRLRGRTDELFPGP